MVSRKKRIGGEKEQSKPKKFSVSDKIQLGILIATIVGIVVVVVINNENSHADEIFKQKIQDNTCVEMVFYNPIDELKDDQNRYEPIKIFLHNSMQNWLENVEYTIMTPNNTSIQNISFSPDYNVSQKPQSNNSLKIFDWEPQIKVDTTTWLLFNLTWNKKNFSSDFISPENISFHYYVRDYPITKIRTKIKTNRTEFDTYIADIDNGCSVIR